MKDMTEWCSVLPQNAGDCMARMNALANSCGYGGLAHTEQAHQAQYKVLAMSLKLFEIDSAGRYSKEAKNNGNL